MDDMNISDLQNDIAMLRGEIKELKDSVKGIRGNPTINGYSGKRLVLNENCDVIRVLKRISDLESNSDTDTLGGHEASYFLSIASGSVVKYYSRDIAKLQDSYTMLGSWSLGTDNFFNKIICASTSESASESSIYCHVVAPKNATGGAWKKCFSLKENNGAELGVEINIDNSTAQVRIATYKTWA